MNLERLVKWIKGNILQTERAMPARERKRMELNDGMYLTFETASNGLGGFHPVNVTLHNQVTGEEYPLLDEHGKFLRFPGIKEGKWREKMVGNGYLEGVDFTLNVGRFIGGQAFVEWLVQPDGQYWADEDGFGRTPEDEVSLYSMLSKTGEFLRPFSDENPEKRSGYSVW